MVSTDFWWLSPEEAREYRYIDLFNQEPYSDESNTDREPLACPMRQSERRYPFNRISQWKAKYTNINVFRSFAVYNSDIDGEKIFGPLLLDIDRTVRKEGGYLANLDKALEDSRLLVDKYCSIRKQLKQEEYRIFFTGHKGFHIEILPEAISIPPNVSRLQCFQDERKEINGLFGDSFIDKFHSHVRLHNSINSWIDYSGRRVYSMNFELRIDELFSLSIRDISTQAENLASSWNESIIDE